MKKDAMDNNSLCKFLQNAARFQREERFARERLCILSQNFVR